MIHVATIRVEFFFLKSFVAGMKTAQQCITNDNDEHVSVAYHRNKVTFNGI